MASPSHQATVSAALRTAVLDSARARPEVESWEELYAAHWRWIYQLARRIGGPDLDTEDVVQDVFVVLARKLHEFEGRSALRTWIYRIALNVIAEHKRRLLRRKRLHVAASAVAFWRESSETAHDIAARNQELARMHRLLGKLSRKRREVLILREVEQLSTEEIADIVQTPVATVRTRLFHARKELQRLWAKGGDL